MHQGNIYDTCEVNYLMEPLIEGERASIKWITTELVNKRKINKQIILRGSTPRSNIPYT